MEIRTNIFLVRIIVESLMIEHKHNCKIIIDKQFHKNHLSCATRDPKKAYWLLLLHPPKINHTQTKRNS